MQHCSESWPWHDSIFCRLPSRIADVWTSCKTLTLTERESIIANYRWPQQKGMVRSVDNQTWLNLSVQDVRYYAQLCDTLYPNFWVSELGIMLCLARTLAGLATARTSTRGVATANISVFAKSFFLHALCSKGTIKLLFYPDPMGDP